MKKDAYWERNQLVLYLSKIYPSWMERHPETDTSWDDDWRNIVFIYFQEGSYSWHIQDEEMQYFKHLEMMNGNSWDGSTTEQKYAALEKRKSFFVVTNYEVFE